MGRGVVKVGARVGLDHPRIQNRSQNLVIVYWVVELKQGLGEDWF